MSNEQFVMLCECGCGLPTPIAKSTKTVNGHIKGQPVRFIHGHYKPKSKYAPTCTVSDCDRRHFAVGYCQKHYTRMLRHGDLVGFQPHGEAAIRFWMRVDKAGANGCWIWAAARGNHGYGTLQGDNGRTIGAHRFSYEMHHGAIPAGLVVMHSCDNPPCVNPAHLSVGTHADNARDMAAKGRARNQRTAAR